ncbi:carbon-nitrogen family hydrolase [Radiobacillus sp. PE A8.2]|uniref:carbon-nitrogen family hydrolase n=1 Tax=Radiobacillus sp. PE A8.2 TaxID=3380349 RepID=UPI00389062AF
MIQHLALLQIDISYGKPEANFEKVERIFHNLHKDTDIVILPELWTTGYDLTRLAEIADVEAKQTISFISTLAQKHDVDIVAGSVAKQSSQGVTNTLLIINRDGQLVKEYSKAHLFRLMNEEKHLIEGSGDGLFTLNEIPSAGLICYDLRFPEWVRTHMLAGTKLLYVVAEWPKVRIDHWRALLISRAIENQCFVIACNRVGSDPSNLFGGKSMIIDPWGEIVVEAAEEEIILYGEINTCEVDKVRDSIPIFSDRRSDIYRLK